MAKASVKAKPRPPNKLERARSVLHENCWDVHDLTQVLGLKISSAENLLKIWLMAGFLHIVSDGIYRFRDVPGKTTEPSQRLKARVAKVQPKRRYDYIVVSTA